MSLPTRPPEFDRDFERFLGKVEISFDDYDELYAIIKNWDTKLTQAQEEYFSFKVNPGNMWESIEKKLMELYSIHKEAG